MAPGRSVLQLAVLGSLVAGARAACSITCNVDQFCDLDDKCKQQFKVNTGPCVDRSKTTKNSCEGELACFTNTQITKTCRAYGKLGDSCTTNPCHNYLFCDDLNTAPAGWICKLPRTITKDLRCKDNWCQMVYSTTEGLYCNGTAATAGGLPRFCLAKKNPPHTCATGERECIDAGIRGSKANYCGNTTGTGFKCTARVAEDQPCGTRTECKNYPPYYTGYKKRQDSGFVCSKASASASTKTCRRFQKMGSYCEQSEECWMYEKKGWNRPTCVNNKCLATTRAPTTAPKPTRAPTTRAPTKVFVILIPVCKGNVAVGGVCEWNCDCKQDDPAQRVWCGMNTEGLYVPDLPASGKLENRTCKTTIPNGGIGCVTTQMMTMGEHHGKTQKEDVPMPYPDGTKESSWMCSQTAEKPAHCLFRRGMYGKYEDFNYTETQWKQQTAQTAVQEKQLDDTPRRYYESKYGYYRRPFVAAYMGPTPPFDNSPTGSDTYKYRINGKQSMQGMGFYGHGLCVYTKKFGDACEAPPGYDDTTQFEYDSAAYPSKIELRYKTMTNSIATVSPGRKAAYNYHAQCAQRCFQGTCSPFQIIGGACSSDFDCGGDVGDGRGKPGVGCNKPFGSTYSDLGTCQKTCAADNLNRTVAEAQAQKICGANMYCGCSGAMVCNPDTSKTIGTKYCYKMAEVGESCSVRNGSRTMCRGEVDIKPTFTQATNHRGTPVGPPSTGWYTVPTLRDFTFTSKSYAMLNHAYNLTGDPAGMTLCLAVKSSDTANPTSKCVTMKKQGESCQGDLLTGKMDDPVSQRQCQWGHCDGAGVKIPGKAVNNGWKEGMSCMWKMQWTKPDIYSGKIRTPGNHKFLARTSIEELTVMDANWLQRITTKPTTANFTVPTTQAECANMCQKWVDYGEWSKKYGQKPTKAYPTVAPGEYGSEMCCQWIPATGKGFAIEGTAGRYNDPGQVCAFHKVPVGTDGKDVTWQGESLKTPRAATTISNALKTSATVVTKRAGLLVMNGVCQHKPTSCLRDYECGHAYLCAKAQGTTKGTCQHRCRLETSNPSYCEQYGNKFCESYGGSTTEGICTERSVVGGECSTSDTKCSNSYCTNNLCKELLPLGSKCDRTTMCADWKTSLKCGTGVRCGVECLSVGCYKHTEAASGTGDNIITSTNGGATFAATSPLLLLLTTLAAASLAVLM